MTKELTITHERVEDKPFLMVHMKKIKIPWLLNENFSSHGNWAGLSLGWVAAGWLSHILSKGDNRMSHSLSFILRALSGSERWETFERELNQGAVRKVLRRNGWQACVTNALQSEFSLSQAVLAYRDQYIVERGCGD